MTRPPRITILGAGPIGLEAGLAAAARGWPFAIYEAGDEVAAHVREWGHVRLFTPWEMAVSPRARAALGGHAPGGSALPTGSELAERLLAPLARGLGDRVHTGVRVDAVSRAGLLKSDEIGTGRRARHPFRLLLAAGGGERVAEADVVLDCTGTWGHPNALGDGGIPAPGERALAARIERRLPDFRSEPERWAGRRILLTGHGHSAQTAAQELADLARHAPGTRVVWALRRARPDFGAVPGDPLPARAALTAAAVELAAGASPAVQVRPGSVAEALSPAGERVRVTLRNGQPEGLEVDRIVALNGAVGDASLYRQLQVHECYATGGPMELAASLLAQDGDGDCLAVQPAGPQALLTPEPGFFVLGAKSYGRTGKFLLRHGWRQVDDVYGLLDGR